MDGQVRRGPTHPKGQIVGYVRVSAMDQNEARQVHALGEVDRLYTEKISGKDVTGRPALTELLTYVREGDVVRVKSPDRLSRSTTDLLALIRQLRDRGAAVEFVDNPSLNTDSPQGEFMLTILAAVAQLERATIRERQAEGIALAKERGVYERAPRMDSDQIAFARERIAAGASKAAIARQLGVSRQTLYTALAGRGAYSS
ncbi:recombinase family protein [Brachybacterium sp.]|uniref:recombinase family protein n=1 Tax=Brachybacterium sp. TaxID=1891286 RepID=UPI002ED0FF88